MKPTLALLALLVVGCSTNPVANPDDASVADVASDRVDATAADAGVTLAVIEERVFRPHCAIPSCHASAEPTGHMRLDEDFPGTSLRGVSAMGVSCSNQGFVRVVPGDPAGSLLYRKISEDLPPCGSRMPQGMEPLSPELIELVRGWIAAGAP